MVKFLGKKDESDRTFYQSADAESSAKMPFWPGLEAYERLGDLPQETVDHLFSKMLQRKRAGNEQGYTRLLNTAFEVLNPKQLNQLDDFWEANEPS